MDKNTHNPGNPSSNYFGPYVLRFGYLGFAQWPGTVCSQNRHFRLEPITAKFVLAFTTKCRGVSRRAVMKGFYGIGALLLGIGFWLDDTYTRVRYEANTMNTIRTREVST